MVEVAIIGAGVGGLTAAIDLAARGASVTVYEAADQVGGKLGHTMIDGVRCDTGPSLLTMRHVFDELFADAGATFEDAVGLLPHTESTLYRWSDDELMLFGMPDATLQSIRDNLGAGAAEQFASFLDYAKRIWEAAAPAFVYADAPTIRGSVGQLRQLTRIDPLRTMADAIRAHVKHERLRDILFRFATYNGSDPRRAPATLNCIAHVELSMGTYGVSGGMYELALALRDLGMSLGVEYKLSTPVRRIVTDRGGYVTGVETDAGIQMIQAVVGNADAAHVLGDLVESESAPDVEPSMSGWNAIIRTTRRQRPPHQVLFPDRYLEEFEDIFDRQRAPRDPTIYVCAPETAHHVRGTGDGEFVFIMANAPARGTTDADAVRKAALGRLRTHDVIDADASVVWERTPKDLAARFPGSEGAIYGASSNSKFAAFRRPANRVASVPGLYLASGSAHPGGGVPMCALSGRAAARAVAADFELPARTGSG